MWDIEKNPLMGYDGEKLGKASAYFPPPPADAAAITAAAAAAPTPSGPQCSIQ
jgi:hypothetical protein